MFPSCTIWHGSASNIVRANQVVYGFVPPELSAGNRASNFGRFLVYIPAILPVLSIPLAFILFRKKRSLRKVPSTLLATGLALAASCYPRWANNNLLFASPLLMAFLFAAAAHLIPAKRFCVVGFVALIVCFAGMVLSLDTHTQYVNETTPLGDIEVNTHDLPNVQFATAAIHPGETLFVFPYQPIWYSLTGGVNPTSFDFMQPGMMTPADESKVLGELEANPPQWIIWHNLSPRTILSIWPNSDPATLRFSRIESYIRTHYAQIRPPETDHKYAIAIFGRP